MSEHEIISEKEFLEFVLKALVTKQEAVKVTRQVDEMGVLLTVDVDAVDMSKVIGREGRTAKAIRDILKVVGFNNKVRATMKINEPEG